MNLTKVILGEVATEKAERLKTKKVHTLKVDSNATKVDVSSALRRHYGVEPTAVRIVKVRAKKRLVARGRSVQKRNPSKRALVTLSQKSKAFDITKFQT
jgi:ribosomal protein L23